MDDADYLLAVASSDRNLLSTGDSHSTEMLASIHAESKQQSKILEKQQQDWENDLFLNTLRIVKL